MNFFKCLEHGEQVREEFYEVLLATHGGCHIAPVIDVLRQKGGEIVLAPPSSIFFYA